MRSGPRHTYYLCTSYAEPRLWNPFAPDQAININTTYFSGVFRAMERHLDADGLTIYLTWNIETLPSYGDRVVAVVLGDEWCRIPHYAHRVRAVFKCYGTRPSAGSHLLRRPSYLGLLAGLQYLRMHAYRFPGVIHRWNARWRRAAPTPVFPIPLGYANQDDLPVKPLPQRRYDLFFAGSIDHKTYPVWSPKRWLQTPKSRSRKEMLAELERLRVQHADLRVKVVTQPSFTPHKLRASKTGLTQPKRSYSEEMMDTILCPVPRGTSLETFRYFEGLRYGCIVITEALPPRWFYDGAPTLRIDRWSELGDLVPALLADPGRLDRLHRQALDWWQTRCSEEAVGRYIAGRLTELLTSSAHAVAFTSSSP